MTIRQLFTSSNRVRVVWGLALLSVLLFAFQSTAAGAVSPDEYQKSLNHAITALDTLGQMDENESAADYERRLAQTTGAVRNALPEKLEIEVEGSVSTVDNSWLHDALREFESAAETQRELFRIQIIERLRSIEVRIAELNKAKVVNSASKAEANQKLKDILARSEYAAKNKEGSALIRLIERFVTWLLKFLPQRSPLARSHGSPLTTIAQIVVVALAGAVIIFVGVRLLRHFGPGSRSTKVKRKKEPRIVLGERLEPEASASDLLAEAEALARNGEIRLAIRKTYIALLVELGDRKIISLAQHKTNRDYLRAVSTLPSLYRNMSGLTESFERSWYGFVQTSQADWQNFRTSYLAALRAND